MYYYRLEIRTEESDLKEKLNSILGLKPNVLGDTFWVYEKESYLECDFISYSLSLLNGKYDELNDIGIDRSMITIWILYEYDNDIGSLYFSPEQLNGLGEEKINLCISCWDKCNPTFTIEDITVKDDMFNAFDIYTLRIDMHDETNVEKVNHILQEKANEINGTYWCYNKKLFYEEFFDFFPKHFIRMLRGKIQLLKDIGISRRDISFELEYHYDCQCNMEFPPRITLLLGKEGVRFVIRCIDGHIYGEKRDL